MSPRQQNGKGAKASAAGFGPLGKFSPIVRNGQTTGNHAEETGRLKILVMFAEHVAANEPPYGTAHEYVGRKVLFSKDACEAETGGEAIGSNLGHRSVIFGCYDGG